MNLYRILFSRWVWSTIIIISIIGASIGFFYAKKRQSTFLSAEMYRCVEFRDTVKNSSIIVVNKKDLVPQYQSYFEGKGGYQNFKSYALPEGAEVYLIEKSKDGLISHAQLKNPKGSQRTYREFWIWSEFLVKK